MYHSLCSPMQLLLWVTMILLQPYPNFSPRSMDTMIYISDSATYGQPANLKSKFTGTDM